ncbi:MAG: type IV secretion system protein [Acidobacteriia bacterium]|nr:type IV secretion system protein [Terriglobia bacterium]
MPTSQLIALPVKDYAAAKRQFVEIYGSPIVMNTYLKIALLCSNLVCVCLIGLVVKSNEALRNFKPPIIRIDGTGRTDTLSYGGVEYSPREAEVRYFLNQFVEQYYGRIRSTLKRDYSRSLYFLDGRLADSIMASDRKSKAIEEFLAGRSEEIEINVKNVSIEDLRAPPYHATVDFEKIYFSPHDRQELRREKYTGNFVFVVKDQVSNAMIPVNPLGFTITYFRDDQAFQP